MNSSFHVIILVISMMVASSSGAFQAKSCQFGCGLFQYEVQLTCVNNVCICKSDRNRAMADASFYEVELQGDKCTIGDGAPCGESNGMEISCRGDLQCLQGHCRDTKQFGKRPLNHSCMDSQDCQTGLVCKMTDFYYGPFYRCVPPSTPEYDFRND